MQMETVAMPLSADPLKFDRVTLVDVDKRGIDLHVD